ncbi:dentin sialophosphoprotein [Patella vulgata]|uniref:dentin sialophosphoprotein n=1 Tax=Patella vulgata TaxID=6465 RepID=UPI00218079DD|nr:dentin sialophosphoprotein [Patella vulgata]XP_050406109.1 dentin sialophosphoprotein [Patella vulgata]XP_055957408.1 dentin sialophosphoprotein [Patella vulgata]
MMATEVEPPVSRRESLIIIEDEEFLRDHIEARDYTSYLYVFDIFNEEEMESVDAIPEFSKRNERFLKILSEKGRRGFRVFKKGLAKRGFLDLKILHQRQETEVELSIGHTIVDRAWRETIEQKDEQQILNHFDYLVRKIEASNLTSFLVTKNVIDGHDMNSIDTLPQPLRNKEFLRIICCRGSRAFMWFVEGLRMRGNGRLCNLLLGRPITASTDLLPSDSDDTDTDDSSDDTLIKENDENINHSYRRESVHTNKRVSAQQERANGKSNTKESTDMMENVESDIEKGTESDGDREEGTDSNCNRKESAGSKRVKSIEKERKGSAGSIKSGSVQTNRRDSEQSNRKESAGSIKSGSVQSNRTDSEQSKMEGNSGSNKSGSVQSNRTDSQQSNRKESAESNKRGSAQSNRGDSQQSNRKESAGSNKSGSVQSNRADRQQSNRAESAGSNKSGSVQSNREDSQQSNREDSQQSNRKESAGSNKRGSVQSNRGDSQQSNRKESAGSNKRGRVQSDRGDSQQSNRKESFVSKGGENVESERKESVGSNKRGSIQYHIRDRKQSNRKESVGSNRDSNSSNRGKSAHSNRRGSQQSTMRESPHSNTSRRGSAQSTQRESQTSNQTLPNEAENVNRDQEHYDESENHNVKVKKREPNNDTLDKEENNDLTTEGTEENEKQAESKIGNNKAESGEYKNAKRQTSVKIDERVEQNGNTAGLPPLSPYQKITSRKISREPIVSAHAMRLKQRQFLLEDAIEANNVALKMVGQGIIDKLDVETIRALRDDHQRVRELVSLVSWGGSKAYDLFLEALDEADYPRVRQVLTSDNDMDIETLAELNQHKKNVDQLDLQIPSIIIDDVSTVKDSDSEDNFVDCGVSSRKASRGSSGTEGSSRRSEVSTPKSKLSGRKSKTYRQNNHKSEVSSDKRGISGQSSSRDKNTTNRKAY